MVKSAKAIVSSIEYTDGDITKFNALLDNREEKCINYNNLTGKIKEGDSVLLNTTAVEKELGSGGYHFVMANLSNPNVDNLNAGHIMKLRYTLMQINCLTVEAQESKYHSIFNEFVSLDGFPVLIGSLHSMLAPCSIYMKSKRPDIKIAYIMTDGGALPIYISEIVKSLRNENVIDFTITYGNAFGGDFECINIYTALITAKEICKADAAIVCMGPGIVGTDTKYGFSGIEQGQIIDAANNLGGNAIHVPRISFADDRSRHYGISHHSITILKDICCTKTNIAIPKLENQKYMSIIDNQIDENKLNSLHNVNYVGIDDAISILSFKKDYMNKMGKGLYEDAEYFLTCAAAGKMALEMIS